MRLTRIVRTATFRMVALYVLVFAGSVAALGAVVYWSTHSALQNGSQSRIQAEAAALESEFQAGGRERLVADVKERERSHPVGPLNYLVVDSTGRRRAGDLPYAPAQDGMQDLRYSQGGSDFGRLRVIATTLPDGTRLVVGDDLERIEEVETTILGAFASAFGVVLALGIAGGLALSTAFLRRLDAITRTAEAIIAGDLRLRVPLQGTNDDLDRLASTLNRMLDRIGSLMESLRQVSSDVAHDLRTPLARLRQKLEQAQRQARSVEDYQAATEDAVAHVDDVLATFGALLRIAQIEAGTRRAGFGQVDLTDVFGTVVEAFLPAAEDSGHRLVARIEPRLSVEGDRELLTQMAANLVENAIRHTREGTLIEVTVQRQEVGVTAAVSDNGPGVPASEREHIFQRFYRLERSRSTPGNGLGLSTVAAVAELHGVLVKVEDNRPGLRMVLIFPSEGLSNTSTAAICSGWS